MRLIKSFFKALAISFAVPAILGALIMLDYCFGELAMYAAFIFLFALLWGWQYRTTHKTASREAGQPEKG